MDTVREDEGGATRAVRQVILDGTIDEACPLSILRANPLVWSDVFGRLDRDALYRRSVRVSDDAFRLGLWYGDLFPPPSEEDINVNMMPFKLFDPEGTLPASLHPWTHLVRSCMACYTSSDDYRDRVGYLTVHESDVAAGTTQRRPGLHVERPLGPGPVGPVGGSGHVSRTCCTQWAIGKHQLEPYFPDLPCWGLGHWDTSRGVPVNGIFFASAFHEHDADTGTWTDESAGTVLWPATIESPESVSDEHGGIEHMREYLPNDRTHVIGNGELVWLTDRTPHEPLPAAVSGRRQFFRLVAGPISVWYSRHNTPNPLGVAPGAPISDIDKFSSS